MLARSLNQDIPAEASEQRCEVGRSQFEELTGLDFDAPVYQYIGSTKFHISPHDQSLMQDVPHHVIAAVAAVAAVPEGLV